jgi:hypothetical protein
MSSDNDLVGPFTRKALRDNLLEAYSCGRADGSNHYGQLVEKYWADAHVDEMVADEPKPASAIPTPTSRLDRIVEGVVLSDNPAPLPTPPAIERLGAGLAARMWIVIQLGNVGDTIESTWGPFTSEEDATEWATHQSPVWGAALIELCQIVEVKPPSDRLVAEALTHGD